MPKNDLEYYSLLLLSNQARYNHQSF